MPESRFEMGPGWVDYSIVRGTKLTYVVASYRVNGAVTLVKLFDASGKEEWSVDVAGENGARSIAPPQAMVSGFTGTIKVLVVTRGTGLALWYNTGVQG